MTLQLTRYISHYVGEIGIDVTSLNVCKVYLKKRTFKLLIWFVKRIINVRPTEKRDLASQLFPDRIIEFTVYLFAFQGHCEKLLMYGLSTFFLACFDGGFLYVPDLLHGGEMTVFDRVRTLIGRPHNHSHD